MSDYPFPKDLIDAQHALHQAQHALRAHYRTQPSWAEQSRQRGTFEHPEAALPVGMTPEEYDRQKQLEARVSELAATVHGHSFWTTLSGPDLLHARDALRHTDHEE